MKTETVNPPFFTRLNIAASSLIVVIVYGLAAVIHAIASRIYTFVSKLLRAPQAFEWAMDSKSIIGLVTRCVIIIPNVAIALALYALLEPVASVCSVFQAIAVRGMEIIREKIDTYYHEEDDGGTE